MKKKEHEIVTLLKKLRAEGIVCSTCSVGGVTLDGVMWLAEDDGKPKKAEPRLSMWDSNVEAIKNMPASPSMDVPPETLIDG